MDKYSEINEARRLLGLNETATLKEIKSAFRRLANYHHPDKHNGNNEENHETMKRLNRAYKVLMDYCIDYKYSFKEEDVAKIYPYEGEINKWRDRWSF